jgi:hypothetical protein
LNTSVNMHAELTAAPAKLMSYSKPKISKPGRSFSIISNFSFSIFR